MRRLPAVFLLLAAACSSGGTPPPEPAGSILARFPPGAAQDIIEVTVRDRAAARSAALVGPGGALVPAYAIDAQPGRHSERPYGSLAPGVPAGFAVAGTPTATTATDEIVTTAFIRVPDVFDYRQNWQAYRIRVEIGTAPADLRAVAVPAPPPA